MRVIGRTDLKKMRASDADESTVGFREIETTVFDPAKRVSKHTLMKSETQPASVVSISH